MLRKEYNLYRKGKIALWDEGMPMGNGDMGGLLFGDNQVVLSLDKGSLWDNRPAPETFEEGYNYANLVKLVKEGTDESWEEVQRLFCRITRNSTPTKINAGKIVFEMPINDESEFSLDLRTGEACVKTGKKQVKTFICAEGKFGVALIKGDVKFHLEFPDYYYDGEHYDELNRVQKHLGYAKPEILEENGVKICMHQNSDCYFGIAYTETKERSGKRLHYYVFNQKTKERALSEIKQAFLVANQKYATLKKAQRKWWDKYWLESSADIPDREMERVYYLAYYQFGSANRVGNYPMPLQGLWTACGQNLPPWKGDYHHDLNSELTYAAYLRANHMVGECFIDHLWRQKDIYEEYARNFFGVDGLLVPAAATAEGKQVGGWPMYAYAPVSSVWVAKSFDDYYRYTNDEHFMKERAYPFFAGVAKAIFALMYKNADGKWCLPLSSTPEYHEGGREAYMEWTNYDLQLIRYMCETLIDYCDKLGLHSDIYKERLLELDEFYFSEDGRIFALNNKKELWQISHRHLSHMMCVYPLKTYKADCEEHIRVIEENLIFISRLGYGMMVGCSWSWLASMSAMIGKGNRAYFLLKMLCKQISKNGFCISGDFRDYGMAWFRNRNFLIEGSFDFCDAVQNMMIQDHLGYISLFSAIPEDWEEERTAFKNFRLLGGGFADAAYDGKKTVEFTIRSEDKRVYKVKNNFGKEELHFSNGQKVVCKQGEVFELTVQGEVKLLNK